MNKIEESIVIDDKKLTLQFGKLAQAVDSSVYATLGDTAVLVTVAVGEENPNLDYFPLSVEYAEKLYAGGIIKGSRWVKREGRPSDEAVLTGRLIDRSIRPLFPKNYKNQVQVVITLLSVDSENSPEILSAIAVSAALHVSSVPWEGPISTMRVGYVKSSTENGDGGLILNPTDLEQQHSILDLVVSSTEEKVLMIEAESQMVSEDIIKEGIEMAKQENKKIVDFIKTLREKIGREKQVVKESETYDEIVSLIKKEYKDLIEKAIAQSARTAGSDSVLLNEIIDDLYTKLDEKYDKKEISAALTTYNYAFIKSDILENKKRPDGRAVDEVRELYVETSLLPRTHGSALFQRGQTQVLSTVTLGSSTLEQTIEGPEGTETKRYIHHYSDGPYSYGTVGRMMSPSRRAIGHGALAEKAIEPVLPSLEEFPYAMRVVSEILAENGSSSMGSVCGSSLALMDAGVLIKEAVAGVAMGIVTKSDSEYVVLTDIVGLEDFAGEMDFKIAGTKTGITAIQLDVKNRGLTKDMIEKIFTQGNVARLHILEAMHKVIDRPRGDVSPFAPKVVILTPPEDKIGEIIGPGGKNIKRIIAQTQTEINITDDGKVSISGVDRKMVDIAVDLVANVYRQVQIGEEFEGEVKRILQFGAFVEFLPGKEGLVHVSKMGSGFVKDPHDVVQIGDRVRVKVDQVDSMGRINLMMIPKQSE
ncbi:polyribonucleotide nucleotidyltransferase [Candidatus Roizmanbacteria bacterium RIFCSPHIGHO2_02_FULL_40_13b]|uniref:Polyribonucleotide nucleotidyltransferase n=1 Tax=Candidatus Roizmanbacteria bacterium RIFCSPHIGHO2_01_FULL_39_24 TaxID=1802032 RepID=A0A1F7GLB6_9BACT|nr:MAG: polyribonucleotide nucleotidyltransferase [Candidatus Roizmanbacteria bacterium RIFCSPHIGHO2_01_FULL_39_24]OGK26989.1 MAG: polyribonucleotide nucleotidyltransferase [Candidatus Roizmanbacteria bacterium RIFCSPHIGHO2_02_FULL_40_13b]OGK48856.1 MAG: polyribonucleotide nucleotidyltransferase [Candidatus Roizmanbacteria bacterium RIFCSPLOWO2_01_FULL_40_32]